MGRNRGYAGSVTIQGKELSGIREGSLMERVTLVSHNSYLFKGTVEDNLRMGKPDATEEEMKDALKKVNLWGFLQAQQGLGTPVAEKGSNFSGGQCQRLAIARALLHDTPVYIFDEATSNIDAESEEMIMEVIHRLAETKTILLISHPPGQCGEIPSNLYDAGRTRDGSGNPCTADGAKRSVCGAVPFQMELERYGKGGVCA